MQVTGSEGSLCLSVGLKRKKKHLFVLVYCKHPNKSKGTCAESVKVQPVTVLCWIGVGDWCLIKSSNSSMLSDSTN